MATTFQIQIIALARASLSIFFDTFVYVYLYRINYLMKQENLHILLASANTAPVTVLFSPIRLPRVQGFYYRRGF